MNLYFLYFIIYFKVITSFYIDNNLEPLHKFKRDATEQIVTKVPTTTEVPTASTTATEVPTTTAITTELPEVPKKVPTTEVPEVPNPETIEQIISSIQKPTQKNPKIYSFTIKPAFLIPHEQKIKKSIQKIFDHIKKDSVIDIDKQSKEESDYSKESISKDDSIEQKIITDVIDYYDYFSDILENIIKLLY